RERADGRRCPGVVHLPHMAHRQQGSRRFASLKKGASAIIERLMGADDKGAGIFAMRVVASGSSGGQEQPDHGLARSWPEIKSGREGPSHKERPSRKFATSTTATKGGPS